MIKVAPSILAADVLNMERDVQRMLDAGVDMIHVDVMDAHFVPNLSYGPAVVQALHKRFPDALLDVHLMMDNPAAYIPVFAEAGAWNITIHAEIPGDVKGMLTTIRSLGVRAGLSLKPATPAEAAKDMMDDCDMILVMTVEPGFGGQKFQPAMLDKLQALRSLGYQGLLEADGGVSLSNLPALRDSGLDVAVMGTAMYRSADAAADVRTIHAL